MRCLNLNASAAVKVTAIRNVENVARKVEENSVVPLQSCIKKDVTSQGETKRYLVGSCETRFVERHVSIPIKYSKTGAKNFKKFARKLFKMHPNGHYSMRILKNFTGEHDPGPPGAFCCSSMCFKLFCRKKNALENTSTFGAPSSKKFSD